MGMNDMNETTTTAWSRWFTTAVAVLAGLGTVAAGTWALASPASFARAVNFPVHEHFLHDVGAFQLGLGGTLLLATVWSDALATALAGFLLGNTVHAVNHAVDTHLGGHAGDAWALAVVSLAIAAALVLRLRRLGYVLGAVSPASAPGLAPFVRQKTILLTTYRKDGTPGGSPVSIAVEGDHAYVRSFEKAVKTRRLRRNPAVEVAPATARGKPTGPAVSARMRQLDGPEARHAAQLLARKYPLLHGVLVPAAHRAMRRKTGRTVHFVLTPTP
jgi:PPOX class probable F420-dependent enzyme